MQILIATLAILATLTGCSTTYNSATSGDSSTLIIAPEQQVIETVSQSINEEFPAAGVQYLGQNVPTFSWWHQPLLDRTTFRLILRKAEGTDPSGQPVKGHFFTVDTSGSQFGVTARYVEPLAARISANIQGNGGRVVPVTGYRELTKTMLADAADAKYKACLESLENHPELAPIKAKVALTTSVQQFSALTDDTLPTDTERAAIRRWGELRVPCLDLQVAAANANGAPRSIITAFESANATSQVLIANLYLGKSTYAGFASQRSTLATRTNESIAQIQSELQKASSEAQDRAAQVAAQRAQADAAWAQSVATQVQTLQRAMQPVYAAPAPSRPTNCIVNGNLISCY